MTHVVVTCIHNSINDLLVELHKYALTQGNSGKLDLTVGKRYRVYGSRKNKNGEFLLVLTDTIHVNTPWWMPKALFSFDEDQMPDDWEVRSFGLFHKDIIKAPSVYFNAINDIEDATTKGIEIFKRMQ